LSTFEFMILSIALGTDLVSVAIPIGMTKIRLRTVVSAAVVFALFHIIMILSGYYFGHSLGMYMMRLETFYMDWPSLAVEDWASLLGALVLTGLGIHMIKESWRGRTESETASCPLEGFKLVALAVSVSLDALAAGVSLGIMDVNLIKLSSILGVVIFLMAVLGLVLGRRLGRLLGNRAELFGGMALVLLGGHVFFTAVYC